MIISEQHISCEMYAFDPFLTSGTYMSHLQSLFKSAGITVSHFFSLLPSTLKYLYSAEPVRMHFSRETDMYK